MANTLTGLIQTIYTALDVVSREMVGMIPAVNRDARTEMAALNETITYPVTPGATATSVSPSMTIPEGTDQTIAPLSLTLSKSKAVQIPWAGEEMKSLENAGIMGTIMSDQIEQAFRVITNEVEQDLLNAGYVAASRAVGTATSAPFGTTDDMSDLANLEEVLDDNGAPAGRQCVLTSRGYVGLRSNMSNLFKVNEAGDQSFLRADALGQVYNFSLGKTGAKVSHTKGAGSSYVLNGASSSGDTSIAIDTGSGTVLAGDVVTFAADTVNKYIVGTGVTAPGSIVLNNPGLLKDIADANAMTIGASYQVAGLGFSRDGLLLASRIPAIPANGDLAMDDIIVTDPRSGLSFRVALYKGYHKQMLEVSLAWGVKAVKSNHIALLLG